VQRVVTHLDQAVRQVREDKKDLCQVTVVGLAAVAALVVMVMEVMDLGMVVLCQVFSAHWVAENLGLMVVLEA